MTLDEAFSKYDDTVKLRRKSYAGDHPNKIKILEDGMGAYDIGWLKQMKAWGCKEAVNIGFMIPKTMINDAIADDWEVYEEKVLKRK